MSGLDFMVHSNTIVFLWMRRAKALASRDKALIQKESNLGPPVLEHEPFPSWLSCDGKECVLSD